MCTNAVPGLNEVNIQYITYFVVKTQNDDHIDRFNTLGLLFCGVVII